MNCNPAVDVVVDVIVARHELSPVTAHRMLRRAAERKGVTEEDLARSILFSVPLPRSASIAVGSFCPSS